jgi:transposase
MKNVEESVGIDVSKLTIDVHLYKKNKHHQFVNKNNGFNEMLQWIKKEGLELKQVLFCFEHTGWYCLKLSFFLHELSLKYTCVNPIEIKRSIGLKRAKTDKDDAGYLAHYAWIRREEIEQSIPPTPTIVELQRMMSLREQLVKHTVSLKNLRTGMLQLVADRTSDPSVLILDKTIGELELQTRTIEREMEVLIKSEDTLKTNYKLSKTVKGVGKILAIQMLIHTHNYTRFMSWRQFSSYCGLVPYPYQSGTSIKGRNKIHSISDRKMKSLLSMSAISAIRCDKELKMYYEQRVQEGKPKMVVINIIRNKIVSRIFSTVKRGTPYVEINQFAA